MVYAADCQALVSKENFRTPQGFENHANESVEHNFDHLLGRGRANRENHSQQALDTSKIKGKHTKKKGTNTCVNTKIAKGVSAAWHMFGTRHRLVRQKKGKHDDNYRPSIDPTACGHAQEETRKVFRIKKMVLGPIYRRRDLESSLE